MGAWSVSLMGGEPTVHPQLLEIIRGIREQVGLRVALASNGLLFGTDSRFAVRLKEAGLAKVNLQFDTFKEDVHQVLRGNTFVPEKITAAENIIEAGLSLGTITTVTTLNLGEMKDIVEFGLSYSPQLSTITFDAATQAGRYELDDGTLVLTAEPAVFDEWHLNLATGDLRRVSDRLYLGRMGLP